MVKILAIMINIREKMMGRSACELMSYLRNKQMLECGFIDMKTVYMITGLHQIYCRCLIEKIVLINSYE